MRATCSNSPNWTAWRRAPHNFFLSHHPLLGFAPGKSGPPKAAAMGLASVMRTLQGDALFAPEIDVALYGHVHLGIASLLQNPVPHLAARPTSKRCEGLDCETGPSRLVVAEIGLLGLLRSVESVDQAEVSDLPCRMAPVRSFEAGRLLQAAELHRAIAEHGRGLAGGAPHHRAQTREQVADVERLE